MNSTLRDVWLAILLIALSPVLLAQPAPETGARAQGAGQTEVDRLLAQVERARRLIAERHADPPPDDALVRSAIRKMLRALDPHSAYLSREEWERFKTQQNSQYCGIGASLGERAGDVYIISPQKNAPAGRAGLKYGDRIASVNGQPVAGWSLSQVTSALLGEEKTPVTLSVLRAGERAPLRFELVRASIPWPSISCVFLLPGKIGYVRMNRGFNTTTHAELLLAIRELREREMKSLILDLRGNGGGLLEQAWRVANIFLRQGQKIVSISGRPPKYATRELAAYNPSPDESPLVVLIDRDTASSAEIVAGALQDQDRALIVGETSFGKGLVQTTAEMADGSCLVLTTGKYQTPSGRVIQRPYRPGLAYDYYHHPELSGAAGEASDGGVFLTASGRRLGGGGGIQPDIVVSMDAGKARERERWFDSIFLFVRDWVSSQIPESPAPGERPAECEIGMEAVVDARIDAGTLAAFAGFLRRHRSLGMDPEAVPSQAELIGQQIRRELAIARCGQEAAWRVFVESDEVVQRALQAMPLAAALAADYRRGVSGRKQGLGDQ